MTTRLNPFEALDTVQSNYRSYVETFQDVSNPTIEDWIDNRVNGGNVLYKEPFVQLNQRFQQGTPLQQLTATDILHEGVLDIFTDSEDNPINPYKHQTEAIDSITDDTNTIVSTGTGSGKSFAFGIPIVSHCLRAREQGVDGIKAVIVYPMNALANSQYEDFAERLDKSGLTLGLYTGDTPHNPDNAVEFLQQFGRSEPYSCELISREEMQESPPDILMTNYVMLDYILTRHEDKQLFPEHHAGALQYLVLDEIHTYTGHQGADVAALIRRLREHTSAGDDLTCIGTSATVQSSEGLDADDEIARFASKIFGQDVSPDAVVKESHFTLPFTGVESLPPTAQVTQTDIEEFDGSLDGAADLVDKLLDRDLTPDERASETALGDVLTDHPTVEFLDRELAGESQQITPTEESEDPSLVETYRDTYREDTSLEVAQRELQAALLAGTVGTTEVQGEQQPVFIPKLHSFFSQGTGLVACLTDETLTGNPPHLSEAGDKTCRHCADQHERRRQAFGLSFCRACGQEYYTVTRTRDNHIKSREVSNLSVEEDEVPGYVMRGTWDRDEASLPGEWFNDDGELRDTWLEAIPQEATYCPEHNRLTDGHVEDGQLICGCYGKEGIPVMWVQAPFLFCADCGVNHTRLGRAMELSKMFTFGTVGRSTATDVLIGGTMQELPKDQQKTIAFTDNRQDTALQAAHINNLYQRVKFRRALYHTLKDAGSSVGLTNLGDESFEKLKAHNALPGALPSGRFGVPGEVKNRFSDYLLFHTILELRKSQQRGQQSLEDVGLIDVEYENLDRLAEIDEVWEDMPELGDAKPTIRHEYTKGFLDLFRREAAIDHPFLTDFDDFQQKTINKLENEVKFHKQQRFRFPKGFSDTANTKGHEKVKRLTHPRSQHVRWTKRSLNVDEDRAIEIIENVRDLISDPDELPLIVEKHIHRAGEAFMLNHSMMRLTVHDPTNVSVCPKCKNVVTRSELNMCLNYSCGNVQPEPTDMTGSYFHQLYTRKFGDAVDILAAEHSGQVEGDIRKELETRFREGDELNTIVCTPTMELGIDIGSLSSVFMRNVPPNPSNYAQRSGRAGRQNQASLVTTFCGGGFGGSSHDQYFYQRPQRIIAGEISPPTFLLNNEDLIKSHINALVLEVVDIKFPGKVRNILEISPEETEFDIIPSYRDDLEDAIADHRAEIIDAVKGAFERELNDGDYTDWFTTEFIETQVDEFVDVLDRVFDPWRREYNRLKREHRRLDKKLLSDQGTYLDSRERQAIENRLKDMRNGGKRFYSYQYLRSQGMLPNYGFPRSSCTLTFATKKDDIQRDESKAIREYAPGNHVYYMGQRYGVRYAQPRTQDSEPVMQYKMVCPNCETILMGDDAETASGCHVCGESFSGHHPNSNTMELPDQRATPEENITSDDEERRREGYDINKYYQRTNSVRQFELTGAALEANVTYEPNAQIVTVNSGIRGRDEDDDELSGFALCNECKRWLTSENQIEQHINGRCYANADADAIRREIELYTEGNHDTVTVTTPLPITVDTDQAPDFYTTLKEALYQGILVEFDLDEQELDRFIKPSTGDLGEFEIVIHEASEGGAGALHDLVNEGRFQSAIAEALDILHVGDTDACERACYECLLSYYNQREHEHLDRTLVIQWLQAARTSSLIGHTSDDASEVYEALREQCESSLEQDVLHAVYEGGYSLPDEAQKTIYDGDEPVAQADFFYEQSPQSLVIFVDGPDHDKEHVKQDDERKRERLLKMGYRVVVVRSPEEVDEVWSKI